MTQVAEKREQCKQSAQTGENRAQKEGQDLGHICLELEEMKKEE